MFLHHCRLERRFSGGESGRVTCTSHGGGRGGTFLRRTRVEVLVSFSVAKHLVSVAVSRVSSIRVSARVLPLEAADGVSHRVFSSVLEHQFISSVFSASSTSSFVVGLPFSAVYSAGRTEGKFSRRKKLWNFS